MSRKSLSEVTLAALMLSFSCASPRDQSDILPPVGYHEPEVRPLTKRPPRAKRPNFGAGFYARERGSDGQAWRWMSARGTISLPVLPSRGRLLLRGRAPVELLEAPPTLSIQASGRVLDTRVLAPGPFEAEWLIERDAFAGQPSLDVTLTVSRTATAPNDTRALGLAVEFVDWKVAP